MADRKRFNRESDVAGLDIYTIDDLIADHDYAEGKPRDIWKVLTDPPYIKTGGVVVAGSEPYTINASTAVAFDSQFREINASALTGFQVFDITPGVVNYLTIQYVLAEDASSSRAAHSDNTQSYNARVQDSYRYQWKLQSPVNPEQTGTETETFDIIQDVNDILVFATDQSDPEYTVTFTPTVASITSDDIGADTVDIEDAVSDELNFTVDSFTYNLDLTSNPAGETLTISGVATRINSLAYTANPSLAYDIAFAINQENKIRITSPRDGGGGTKQVIVLSGTANTILGLTPATSTDTSPKTAENIADEINLVTTPETTAVAVGTHVRIQAQDSTGYLDIRDHIHTANDTLGYSVSIIYGANEIDFDNDIILAEVTSDVSGNVTIGTTTRTKNITIVDGLDGWKEQFTYSAPSGGVEYDAVFTLQENTYVVGSNELNVYVNGAYQHLNEGLTEVGTAGTRSTQFQVNGIMDGYHIEASVPKSSPSNLPIKIIKRDGEIVIMGFTEIDFGPEFTVSANSSGGVNVSATAFSGAIMNHAFNHEYGGSDQMSVNHLQGTLLTAQKTDVYVDGVKMWTPTAFNFSGAGMTLEDHITASGFVSINVPPTQHTNLDGDAIITLGTDGGALFSSLTIQDDASDLWEITVNEYGQLVSQYVTSGTPTLIVLQSPDETLYKMTVEYTFGSGEIKTTAVLGETPLNFSLQDGNGKAWAIRVEDGGALYSLDLDNYFQVRDADQNPLLTIRETGTSSVSGDIFIVESDIFRVTQPVIYLNEGETGSGILNNSGGIQINRGSGSPAVILYDESLGGWVMNPGERRLIASEPYVQEQVGALIDDAIVAASGTMITVSGDIYNALVDKVYQISGDIDVRELVHQSQFEALSGQVDANETSHISQFETLSGQIAANEIIHQQQFDQMSGSIYYYTSGFVPSDWYLSGSYYMIDFNHNKNRYPVAAQVYEGGWLVQTDIYLVDNNNLRLRVPSSPDSRFSGDITII